MSDTLISQSFGTTAVSGSTPYGYWDSDEEFQDDAQRFAKHSSRRLGNDIIQVELTDHTFYACYEEAIEEYQSIVNTANFKYWLIDVIGKSTSSNLTHKYPIQSNEFVKDMAEPYARDSGISRKQTLYSASFTLNSEQQLYNILNYLPDIHTSSQVQIMDVLHYAPSSINRSLAAWYGGTENTQLAFSQEFGADFGLIGDATLFYLYPHTFTVQKAQQIELSDRIRRSAFGYEINDTTLRIYPVPTDAQQGLTIWFNYYIMPSDLSQRDTNWDISSENHDVIDVSNAPYQRMTYSEINPMGIRWIKRYAHSLAMETLGKIRIKYSTQPIPDAEITLDGDKLISDARENMQQLKEELIKDLEELDPFKAIQKKADAAEYAIKNQSLAPLGIYIG